MSAENSNIRRTERVRHELKFRVCEVVDKTHITPNMIRVVVTSPDLEGFSSPGYDDHVKLFFAPDRAEFPTPEAGPDGLKFPDGVRLEGRDFTPRFFDPDTNQLTLDFAEHGDGPAISWARKAEAGTKIGVGGPRASFVVHGPFDWYLLIGDETALPAIARRIEELDEGDRVTAMIEVPSVNDIQQFGGAATAEIHWLVRNQHGSADLLSAAKGFNLPNGDGYIFIAGEGELAKSIRAYFVDVCGHNPDWIKAAGYWRKGQADFYDGHAH